MSTNGKRVTVLRRAAAVGLSGFLLAGLAATPAGAADVPNAPEAPSATAGNQSAVVSLTGPTSDNGSPITSYTATCTSSDGGVTGSASAAASPITVPSLTNGKTYTCTVKATNAVGDGNSSPASNAIIPAGPPDAPTITGVVPHNGSVEIGFTAPNNNGGYPVTGYSATCSATGAGALGSNSGTTSPITVTGLTNGRTYHCTVRATNDIGAGPSSAPSAGVVPAGVPNPPTIAAADPGDGAASVNFTPQADNGAAVTSFTATCTSTDGGASGFAAGTKSPVLVGGLTNGNVYSCSVQATNSMGTSVASAASPLFVVGEPGTPTVLTVVPGPANSSTGSLSVSFASGADNGSAITEYDVTCSPVTTGAGGSASGTASPLSIGGLSTGKAYLCSAVATNARGSSRESPSVQAVVGAPGPPRITKVMQLSHGLAFAFFGAAPNGNAIVDYQANCTSSNGGVAQSVQDTASPLVANQLGIGKSYTCALTAENSRGEGTPSNVGPIVVKPPSDSGFASCTGNTGTMTIDPGMKQKTAEMHVLNLAATLGTCKGHYVSSARVSFPLRTKRTASCGSAVGLVSSGTGTVFWTAPPGMGKSKATIQLKITTTGNHVTKATYFGTVASSNGNGIFKGAHVKGTLTLGRGFHASNAGGDCSSQKPLGSLPVTAMTLVLS